MSRAGGTLVVKLGGRSLERAGAPAELAAELARLPGGVVVVHGGGSEVSAWCDRLGITPRFENGLRVTDDATLEVAAAVLAGLVNKRLVAALRGAGLDAVGLSALDGGIAEAVPHREAATLGAVGEVRETHVNLLEALLATGRVPVLASLAADGPRLLNLNADDFAAAIAAALGATRLALFSDVPGVTLGGRVIARMDAAAINEALAGSEVSGGMIPKLAAARHALAGGVTEAWIGAWGGPGTIAALIEGFGPGTRLTAGDAALAARPSPDPSEPTRSAARSSGGAPFALHPGVRHA